jgi:hypothetical protein
MAYEFYLGLDVPDDTDHATVTITEKMSEDETGHEEPIEYRLRELAKLPLHSDGEEPGEEAANRIQTLLVDEPYIGRTILVVNKSNDAGQMMLDRLQEYGLTSFGVALSDSDAAVQEGSGFSLDGGDDAAQNESSFFVSEQALVSNLEQLHRRNRLILPPSNPHISSVAQGLQSYRARTDAEDSVEDGEELDTEASAPSRAIRENTFVRSAALACWLGEQHDFDPTTHLTDFRPATGEIKQNMRPDTAS